MSEFIDLSGLWECRTCEYTGPVTLPGTLDENSVGHADAALRPWHPDSKLGPMDNTRAIATRLTRRHTYEGPAVFRRTVDAPVMPGKRVFLEIERARHLTLRVNGKDVPHFGPHTLSAPQSFELTGLLTGRDTLELTSDNSYPGWPAREIISSSAATDETQTNWNGLLGHIRLNFRETSFISSLRVYPKVNIISVRWDVSGPAAGNITVDSPAISGPVTVPASRGGMDVPLISGVRLWDEGAGALYPLTAKFGADAVTVSFGVREFATHKGYFTLNGRRIFIRSEANCAVFPETGHEPTDADSWRNIIKTYMSYGVNLLRFHSHCPPEAAFEAADKLGLLLQPELSHWNPKDAFSSLESREYYREELIAILRTYANHPSFVMLTLGNELWADENAHEYMESLLRTARALDPTRLYAEGSNNHYGQRKLSPESDFYTSGSYLGAPLRGTNANMTGWLNDPDTDLTVNYLEAVEKVHADRNIPVISFEVGQFEILPDFGELSDFTGVTDPANLCLIRERAEKNGLLPRWREYCEATGELALLCYRMEVEAALRTPGLAGISLLGLQDFPGQGTALVGMLNSHLEPKPYDFAKPQRFKAFFTDVLPLVELEKFTYSAGDTLTANVKIANYGKSDLTGPARWTVSSDALLRSGSLGAIAAPSGQLTALGRLDLPLDFVTAPMRFTLTVEFCNYVNRYDLWAYPAADARPPENVHICRKLDAGALQTLSRGGRVYLEPRPEALTGGVKGQFSTDFWSVGTFPTQSGGMGLLIEKDHPIFASFPTDAHTCPQWRRLASMYALPLPEGATSIVTLMDSYAYMRRLSYIFECRCGGGRLLVSAFGLPELISHPEARALRNSILDYMASDAFAPTGEVPVDTILKAIKND